MGSTPLARFVLYVEAEPSEPETTMLMAAIPTHKQMLDEINTTRERARQELHLLSHDARSAWKDIEGGLVRLQGALEHEGEQLTERVVSGVRELTRSAHDLLERRSPKTPVRLEDTVASVATTALVTCCPEHTLERAAQLMWDHDCGVVPVVDKAGVVLGMLSDRDVCMAAYTRGGPLSASTVESAMSKQVYTCRPDESIGRALELMRVHKVRRLPMVSKYGHLLGLVALADIARRAGSSPPVRTQFVQTFADICEPLASKATLG